MSLLAFVQLVLLLVGILFVGGVVFATGARPDVGFAGAGWSYDQKQKKARREYLINSLASLTAAQARYETGFGPFNTMMKVCNQQQIDLWSAELAELMEYKPPTPTPPPSSPTAIPADAVPAPSLPPFSRPRSTSLGGLFRRGRREITTEEVLQESHELRSRSHTGQSQQAL